MSTAEEWVEHFRGLDTENLVRHGVKIGPSQVLGGRQAVGIPYVQGGELKGYKVRAVDPKDGEPPYTWSPRGLKVGLYNGDVLNDGALSDQPVIITEGEFDTLAIIECGFPRTVSVPHGAQSGAKYVYDAASRMKNSPRVIIAGDMDEPGAEFVRSAAAALDGHMVCHVVWPEGCKDANDTLKRHGHKAVVEAIQAAQPVHPDDPEGGLITGFTDAPPAPGGQIYRSGDQTADRVCCLHSGFPLIVTGTPGSGKSTWLTWYLHHVGERHNIRQAVGLFETPWPILRDHLCRLESGKRWEDLGPKERDAVAETLDAKWRLLNRKEEDNVAADLWWIREMMRVAAVRDGCKSITFDPWNELDHLVPQGEAMTDYVNSALARIRQWAERFDVALNIVAHPTKMQREAGGKVYPPTGYDIAGSAAWYNKAAIGITVHRMEDDRGEFTRIINWKPKFEHLYRIKRGFVEMDYDPDLMCFRRRMC